VPDASDDPGHVVPVARCLTCGHGYAYLGRDPPPAACPACGSHVVTPAEPLSGVRVVPPSDGRTVRVVATDATDRRVRYRFRRSVGDDAAEADGPTPVVPVAVSLGGGRAGLDGRWPAELAAPGVVAALAAAGYVVEQE
jgi:DNA-directed RNA polymerase subunit RPC12/RpoP